MIAIIQGCGNNINSIQFALHRLGLKSCLTSDPEQIRAASAVILPGVGHAAHAMQNLRALELVNVIRTLTQPVLGICLGMQLLYEFSQEGDTPCLGIIPGEIEKMRVKSNEVIPHMGWNNATFLLPEDPLSQSLPQSQYYYFVHSYAAPINEWTCATTQYGDRFTSIVRYQNFYGMQFHPERSGKAGEQLLINLQKNILK